MKLKTVVAYLFPLFIALNSLSQPNPFVCDSLQHGQCAPFVEIEANLLADIMSQKNRAHRQRVAQNIYTIPIVFHIIHKDGPENISDEQIYSAMTLLNQDFNAGNSDLVLVPAPFDGIVGNATIQFKLAQQAPDGSCTNGINRIVSGYDPTYNYYWTDDGQYYLNEIKKTHYWDTDKYLNIYVVNESYNSGLAFFPYQIEAKANSKKWLDGIMLRHYNVGNIGTAKYNNLPHTLAHEIGHYLDLLHIWGNWYYPGSSQLSWENDCNFQDVYCPNFYCFSDDLVQDTPNTEYFFEGCVYETTTCGSADNATNIMAYGCELMFTKGQVNRMHKALNSTLADRNFIWSDENLAYTLTCSGKPASINCKKLYSSFIENFSIIDPQTAYIVHFLNGITNKVRYRINGENWIEFPASDNYYYTINEVVACAKYEFQISEQCDTIFSAWSDSKTFYTDDTNLPEVSITPPDNFINCNLPDSISTANCETFALNYEIQHQSYINVEDGTIHLFPEGGNPPYHIQWETGDTTSFLSNLLPGNYSFIATDTLGCAWQDTIQILPVNCDSLELNVQVTHETYFQQNDGTAFVVANGGLHPYNYLWSTGDTIATLYNLSPDSYQISIKDARGCSVTDSVLVEAIDCSLFEVQLLTTQLTYYQSNDGTIEAIISNGIAPYMYNWSTEDTTTLIENLAPETYSVDVVDALGCQATATAIIDSIDCKHLALDIFSEDTSSEDAMDGSALVVVTGGNPPYHYLWSNGETTNEIYNLPADNYSIRVTDSLGCFVSENILINSPFCDSLKIDVNINDENYFGANNGSIELFTSGGNPPYQYNWSNGDTTALVENLTPGDYIVQVNDQSNCLLIDTITIEGINCDTLQIELEITHQTYIDLANGTAFVQVLNGQTPYTYSWSTGDTTAFVEQLLPGTYHFSITDQLGCTLLDSLQIESVNCDSLQVSADVQHESYVDADDGSIQLNASGGIEPYQYEWSSGDTYANLNELAPGLYKYHIIDQQGCAIEDSVQIKEINCNYLSIDVIQKNTSCRDGNDGSLFVANVSGAYEPYQIEWSTGSTEHFIGNLAEGNYELLLIDSLGCTFSDSYILRNGSEIKVTQAIEPASDVQTPDASIDIMVMGGTPPYQFYWSNSSLAEDLQNVFYGTYWLSISDSLNCHALITNIEVGYWQACEEAIIETPDVHASSNYIQAQNAIQSSRIIRNNQLIQYKAGSFIELMNDFEVLQGGAFEASIDPCE